MNRITIEDIRREAERVANAHNDVAATAAHMQAEIKDAIAPVLAKYKGTLDGYANSEARAIEALDALLIAAPYLFVKPRSMGIDGVRCGYKREPDTLDWADEAAVIAAIRAVRPDLAPLLIRTEESLVIDALDGLTPEERAKVGIRTVAGADRRFITVGDNDVEKLAKAIIADAARRQGEDEAPKTAKGKAKIKAGVAA